MNRRQLLAAETFHYSYAHYADHLGINIRFDKLMPNDVDTLERAEQEGWEDARLAQALEIPEDQVEFWRVSYQRAKDIPSATRCGGPPLRRQGCRSIIDSIIEAT